TRIVLPLFLEGGNEALAPSQNGGVYDRDAALRHQVAHVAITQLVSDILSYGLNDKKMIEMTPLKSSGFSEESWVMPTIIHNYQVCARTVNNHQLLKCQ